MSFTWILAWRSVAIVSLIKQLLVRPKRMDVLTNFGSVSNCLAYIGYCFVEMFPNNVEYRVKYPLLKTINPRMDNSDFPSCWLSRVELLILWHYVPTVSCTIGMDRPIYTPIWITTCLHESEWKLKKKIVPRYTLRLHEFVFPHYETYS